MARLFLLCCSLLLFVQCGTTQSLVTRKTAKGKALKAYEKGMSLLISEQNEKAINEFEKALKANPKFIDAQIQWAAAKYDQKKYQEAEAGFEKVLQIKEDYKTKVYYTLALTEWRLNKFDEATAHFEKFLSLPKANEKLKKQAAFHLANCKFAAYAYDNPVPFKPQSLGNKVNTSNAEYLPSFTADGKTLIYTVRIRGQEDFYISQNVDGEWQEGKELTEVNTDLNEGAQTVSADGKLIVFTACNRDEGMGSCDLYFSEVKNGRWTKPQNIGLPINSNKWESQPSLSSDGNQLFFASNRAGGRGGNDIWMSERNDKGLWSKPVNLGKEINTGKEDQSPFIHQDGQTLYFMSKGHPGMGQHDLYYSRKEADGKWGTPVNLGYPINTKASEGALVISLDGQTAYFASDRKTFGDADDSTLFDSERGGETDLYSFPLYKEARPQPVTYVKAKVFDAISKKPIAASLDFMDLSTGKAHVSSKTESDGEFLVTLPMKKNYSLNVSKEKYFFHSENFSLAEVADVNKPFILEIFLQPIPPSVPGATVPTTTATIAVEPIILRNVFFETGSAALQDISINELDRLKDLLIKNPTLRIQLNGHTDNVGSDSDNMTLSENRAKAVNDYLTNAGISASRLRYKGFGETIPIDTNDTPEGRQRNRRTEFVRF